MSPFDRVPDVPDVESQEGDSVLVQQFAEQLQLLAGMISRESLAELEARLDRAIRDVPDHVGPAAFWIVRGLSGKALQHVESAHSSERRNGTIGFDEIWRSSSTAQLQIAIHRWFRAFGGHLKGGASRDARVAQALDYIRANCLRPSLTLDDVSRRVRLSRWHLGRLLNSHAGASFRQVLRQMRMERAISLLADRALTIKEIAADLGYLYPTEFDRDFKRRFGTTPTAWRTRAVDEDAGHPAPRH